MFQPTFSKNSFFKIFKSCYVSKFGNKILKFVLTNVPMNPKPHKSTPLPQHPNLVLTYLNEHTRPFLGTNKFPKVVPKKKKKKTEEKKKNKKTPNLFPKFPIFLKVSSPICSRCY